MRRATARSNRANRSPASAAPITGSYRASGRSRRTTSLSVRPAPAPSRASAPTPAAVAWGEEATSTGSCSRSACICISTRERCQAAVDPQEGQRPSEVDRGGPGQERDLRGETLHGGTDHMGGLGAGADAVDAGEGVGLPPRCAQAAEGRHHLHTPAVGDCAGDGIEILGPSQETPALQPGDGGAGGIDLPVDAVGGRVAELPGYRDGQAP